MAFTPRYPARTNSESSTAVYTSSPDYEHNFKAHWYNSMYSTQNLNSPSKQQLLSGTVDENAKNFNLNNSRMFATKQSLSVDNMANQPKRETRWQSMFRSVTNLLGEHLGRGTSSFLRNWSSMNNPLSVTVVSSDFYKSWQRGKDHQLVDPASDFYATRAWSKESHGSDETLPNVLYDNEIISDSVKQSISDCSDSDKRWKEYKCMYVDFNNTRVKDCEKEKEVEKEKKLEKDINKDSIMDKEIVNSVNNDDCNDEALESHFNIVIDDKTELDRSTNFGNTVRVDDEPVMLEKPEPTLQETQQEQQEQQQAQFIDNSCTQPTAVGTMLNNAYNKVVNGVADLLQLSSGSSELDSSALFTKRACSPKPRPKRVHNISCGRGRGRAKSQLRRSGVSQTRHRKERSRYDHSEDIKSDIDNWEELEYCHSTDDDGCNRLEDVDECDFARSPGQFDNADEEIVQYGGGGRSCGFTLADVKPRKRKPKKAKNHQGWSQVGVSFTVPSLDEDGDLAHGCADKLRFRPRLMSESSVDSEDSYCIVFENDGCSDESDFETDDESCMATETETEDEDDVVVYDTDVELHSTNTTKVKFDLTPTVHPMIQWNFAYRAARRGPWEEMARDRERFRGHIHRIGRVLEPVLAKQHRMRVWRERFAD